MNRNSLTDMASRVMHLAARVTLNTSDDNRMMQELSFAGMRADVRNAVERVQSFGFSSVPLPREVEEGVAAAAEGIALFLGGQRNHPVVIGMDDRRHRPMGMQPGENAQYDDQGQMTLLRRTGLYLISLDDDGSGTAPGARMRRDKDGNKTGESEPQQRMVSMRHVSKTAQPREPVGGPARGKLSKEAREAQDQERQNYRHEGESVNTEVRCTRDRIEFRAGDRVVGYYDKPSDTWYFTGRVIQSVATEQIKDQAPRIDHN